VKAHQPRPKPFGRTAWRFRVSLGSHGLRLPVPQNAVEFSEARDFESTRTGVLALAR
jgi:hypothetical protein